LIPSSMGYGASGSGAIPPNAGLVFEVTLSAVQ
jgi:FKBP-type peptidyl-prolyl cis-trans isomerase FkpA